MSLIKRQFLKSVGIIVTGALIGSFGLSLAAGAQDIVTLRIWTHDYMGTESPWEGIATLCTRLFKEAKQMFNVKLIEEYQFGYAKYRDKIVATAQANALPDIFGPDNSWFSELAQLDAIQPFNEFWPEEDRKDFFPFAISHATDAEGNIRAVWFYTDCYLTYYRKDLFAQAGLAPLPEDRPLSWTEFTTYAQKLTTDDIWGYMFPAGRWAGSSTGMLGLFWGQGGRLFDDEGKLVIQRDENRKALVNVLQWYHDLIYKYKVAPKESADWKGGAPPHLFLDRKVAMYLGGSWQISEIVKDAPELVEHIAGGFLPQKEGGHASTRCGGFGWAIGTRDPIKQKKAWQVIRLFTSVDNMAQQASSLAVFPTRKSSFLSPYYRKSPISDTARNQLEWARPTPKSPLWSTVDELLQIAVNKVALNMVTPEGAVEEMIKALEIE